jgi:hypothetical protein
MRNLHRYGLVALILTVRIDKVLYVEMEGCIDTSPADRSSTLLKNDKLEISIKSPIFQKKQTARKYGKTTFHDVFFNKRHIVRYNPTGLHCPDPRDDDQISPQPRTDHFRCDVNCLRSHRLLLRTTQAPALCIDKRRLLRSEGP